MEEKKNTQPDNQQAGQNPTLNEPGAQVTDYGSPTGEATPEKEQSSSVQPNENRGGSEGDNETIGNP